MWLLKYWFNSPVCVNSNDCAIKLLDHTEGINNGMFGFALVSCPFIKMFLNKLYNSTGFFKICDIL